MTEQQTAKPIYCRRCQGEIVFPGQYVIVDSLPYHVGCDRPGFAVVTVTERDSNQSAIEELTKEREVYRMRWLASEVDLRLAREELAQMQSAKGASADRKNG